VRNPYKTSVGKPEDKRTPLKPGWRTRDNINMYSVLQKYFKLPGLEYALSPATGPFLKNIRHQLKARRTFV